jgi:cytosine deaminase
MLDLIIRGANLADGRQNIDIGIQGGKIVSVEPALKASAGQEIDAKGRLVTPPFVDAHFHMDATLSLGLPRLNQSGTLLEGIALWGELKPLLTQEAIAERALAYCDWAVAKGLLAIRSHVDICDPRLLALCELAAERGLLVDMHCDETDDPMSRHVETLAYETQRLGLQGRVTGSHLTSMHSMDNYYVSKLIPLMAEAKLNAIANPLINITIQGRHDTYPKRRGMTRVPELMAAGLTVAFGHDCVMDPWYGMGSGDMLEVAHMGLHVAQMTGQDAMRNCFAAVTVNPARILQLDGYGVAPGKNGDLVILQAADPVEAIRVRATRLAVLRRGKVIAETPAQTAMLNLPGRPEAADFLRTR